MGLSNEQELEIANELEGSCLTSQELLLRLNWTGNIQDWEVAKAANNQGIYNCYTCGWWQEEGDIFNAELCTECYEDGQG
jgi:hypothetical protein